MTGANVLTEENLRAVMITLSADSNVSTGIWIQWRMDPDLARRIDWYTRRPIVRSAYRAAGFPFGHNQGAFKRWALLVGRYP